MANDVRKANGKAYFPELSDKSYRQTYSDAAKRQEYLELIDYLESFRGSTEARVYRIADAAKKGLISKEAAEKAIAYETKPAANARDLEVSCAAVSAGCLVNDPDYGQVRLTEQQLRKLISESIMSVMNEGLFRHYATLVFRCFYREKGPLNTSGSDGQDNSNYDDHHVGGYDDHHVGGYDDHHAYTPNGAAPNATNGSQYDGSFDFKFCIKYRFVSEPELRRAASEKARRIALDECRRRGVIGMRVVLINQY